MKIQAVKHGHNKIRKTLYVAKMIGKQRLSVPWSNGSEDNVYFSSEQRSWTLRSCIPEFDLSSTHLLHSAFG